ncbi:MAG: undecaprenyl-diphosphate phosphatase [Treponema sp.]|jgi:undecaprenyl-diphosphatase|nr:undecaprenyl-diphosphate phosphatase [Treponema sp.]
MDIIKAVILGIVQGLTEFLPVSSSGHLVLLQKIFGIKAPPLLLETLLHTGTLAAVVLVLRKDILEILKRPFQPLTLYLIIATVPAVIAALAFSGIIGHAFESGEFLGFCFLVTTVFLITAEIVSKRINTDNNLKKKENMTWLDALAIGVMQAIAIIPGISRSGATISGALARKLDRDLAARFSFLLLIPAILGALVLHVKEFVKGGDVETSVESLSASAIAAGTITAAITGFFAVKLMLKIIREKSLFGFAAYTGILGMLILLDQYVTHIIF